MDIENPIERALSATLSGAMHPDCPPRFASAINYAVFPGGARIRPKLLLAVAHACGTTDHVATLAGACAIELLHCASFLTLLLWSGHLFLDCI